MQEGLQGSLNRRTGSADLEHGSGKVGSKTEMGSDFAMANSS